MRKPQVEHWASGFFARSRRSPDRPEGRSAGSTGPRSPLYQRVMASSRPSRESTRTRPRPSSSMASWSTSSSPVASKPNSSRSSSGTYGSRSCRPTSPGWSRSDHGTHAGAVIAPSPGRSETSHTVPTRARGGARQGDGPAPPDVAGRRRGEVVRREALVLRTGTEVLPDLVGAGRLDGGVAREVDRGREDRVDDRARAPGLGDRRGEGSDGHEVEPRRRSRPRPREAPGRAWSHASCRGSGPGAARSRRRRAA